MKLVLVSNSNLRLFATLPVSLLHEGALDQGGLVALMSHGYILHLENLRVAQVQLRILKPYTEMPPLDPWPPVFPCFSPLLARLFQIHPYQFRLWAIDLGLGLVPFLCPALYFSGITFR